MKVGDLVRAKEAPTLEVGGKLMYGDVILLLKNHGVKNYHKGSPGFLFSGLCIRTQAPEYFIFEHDAEVINESR